MDKFSNACKLFSLTISFKKTQVLDQGTPLAPAFTTNDEELKVVNQFQYLGLTVTDTLSLDTNVLAKHLQH